MKNDYLDLTLGVNCPGCDRELTFANAGGYQTYCIRCVLKMPSIPDGGGYITGRYPNFKWVNNIEDSQT